MDELPRDLELRRETAPQRIVLIDTDIDVGMTFLRIAATELSMGHQARADDLLAKGRRAHEVTAKFFAGSGGRRKVAAFARQTSSLGRRDPGDGTCQAPA